jgi:hypothetical protein
LSQCHCGACFGKKKLQGEKGSILEAENPWATALSVLLFLPGDGKTVGIQAESETVQTVDSEAKPEPSETFIGGMLGVEAPLQCVDAAGQNEEPAKGCWWAETRRWEQSLKRAPRRGTEKQ